MQFSHYISKQPGKYHLSFLIIYFVSLHQHEVHQAKYFFTWRKLSTFWNFSSFPLRTQEKTQHFSETENPSKTKQILLNFILGFPFHQK